MSRTQTRYRFRNDDGSEAAATWAAAENAPITLSPLTKKRLRFQVDVAGDPPSEAVRVQYRKLGLTSELDWRDLTIR